MSTIIKKQRIQYIDALRGFTMFLVVLQHVSTFSFGIAAYETVFSNLFVAFRMPMFFFISGYIAYKSSIIWDTHLYRFNLKKKAIVQLIPTAVFFSLFCFNKDSNPINIFLSRGLDGYWFTFVLFEMFCIYFTVSLLCKKFFNMIMVLISSLGIISLVLFRSDVQWWNVLCMENLCKYFQFFTLGVLCRKYNIQFLNLIQNDLFKTLMIIIFLMCLFIITRTSWGIESFVGKNLVRSILVRYSGLFVVFSFFASKKEFFNQETQLNKWIQFIGRRTLDIYLIHYFLIPIFPNNFAPIIKDNVIFEVLFPSILALIIIVICLLISEVLRSSDFLAHYLFGAKSDKYQLK